MGFEMGDRMREAVYINLGASICLAGWLAGCLSGWLACCLSVCLSVSPSDSLPVN